MSLADAFAGIKAAAEPENVKPVVPAPIARSSTPAPQPRAAPVKQSIRRVIPPAYSKVPKNGNPDYEGAKVYVRRDTRRQAWRKWEDEGGRDFSDLVQKLLEEYLRT